MKKVILTLILSAAMAGAYAQTTPGTGGTGTPTNPSPTTPNNGTPNNNGDPNNGNPNSITPGGAIVPNTGGTPNNGGAQQSPSDTTKITPMTPNSGDKTKPSKSPTIK